MAASLIAALAALVAALLFAANRWLEPPGDFDPVAVDLPPAPPATGTFAPNGRLLAAEKLVSGAVRGPEDVLPDAEGTLFFGDASGWIKQLRRGDAEPRDWVFVGGHPLGLAWRSEGRELVVCEPYQGLLLIDVASRTVHLLTNSSDGIPFMATDNADVAADGSIYFSDASSRFPVHAMFLDLLEGRPHARLLRFHPTTRATHTLLPALAFANGVALTPSQRFLLVAETFRFRVIRYWLKGPLAGTSDIFIDNLPGYPDNINSNGAGVFWIALFTLRQPHLDFIHKLPWLKALIARLPKRLLSPQSLAPFMRMGSAAVGVNEEGGVVAYLDNGSGRHITGLTSVREVDGHLLLGNLMGDYIGRLKL